MTECWKDVLGYEGYYQVSDQGRVRSLPRVIMRSNGYPQTLRGQLLAPRLSAYGHQRIALMDCGQRLDTYIHRLVLEAFIGRCPRGLEACHNDGKHLNNRLSNLRWDTHASNMADTAKHGVRRVQRVQRSDGKQYRASSDADRDVGTYRGSVARSIRLGQQCAGFTWEYING